MIWSWYYFGNHVHSNRKSIILHHASFHLDMLCFVSYKQKLRKKNWHHTSQNAFKQKPAAFKHTPTELHATHFWSHSLSHISRLSQGSVMYHCFPPNLPLVPPLSLEWKSTVLYHTCTTCLCSAHRNSKHVQPAHREAWIFFCSFNCTYVTQ